MAPKLNSLQEEKAGLSSGSSGAVTRFRYGKEGRKKRIFSSSTSSSFRIRINNEGQVKSKEDADCFHGFSLLIMEGRVCWCPCDANARARVACVHVIEEKLYCSCSVSSTN